MKSRILACITAVLSALAVPAQLAAQNALGLKETVLYAFSGGADGRLPQAGLAQDEEGNLYGTTSFGGDLSACRGSGCGTVFKIDPSGNYSVIYAFTGGIDGAGPQNGALILDQQGNLYGTSASGGDPVCDCGTVFTIDPSGRYRLLHTFTGADGLAPFAGLVRDQSGNLYGTTAFGGASGAGVVFKLDPTGNETGLYSFTGGTDGELPWGGLVRDSAGNLYGTAELGGSSNAGVVFMVDPNFNETVLYNFTGGADGATPFEGLARDNQGNLYGSAIGGGTSGAGVVFKLTPGNGGHWTESVLYSFTGGSDGNEPNGDLAQDEHGNLYGITYGGGHETGNYCGSFGCGVVFKLTPRDGDQWIQTVLYTFAGETDGGFAAAGLFRDRNGSLYSTASFGGDLGECGGFGCGVVFKLSVCRTAVCHGEHDVDAGTKATDPATLSRKPAPGSPANPGLRAHATQNRLASRRFPDYRVVGYATALTN